ncbi:aldehyde dehydrogenase (NADP(+)) [Ruegeria sp. EL01]|jgi:NADP-dependent aldehyde dehydrogenase|uniref:aldehyde dehydrogenase (NADP(+)) n=1 Tax=Ruegeria sp. EL01 TaxID=2107578 RepID=UPI000EA80DED|nr:aldehyde dehydrogenase (NADP(+)) [Ruegeria sp. EL01]
MSLDTVYNMHGQHLIGGQWVGSDGTFLSDPARGPSQQFSVGSAALIDQACKLAEAAFQDFSSRSRQERATFLNAIADEIEARADAITQIGSSETGLPKARLQGERGRTVGQLRLFADYILQGDYLERRHDPAQPGRQPAPRPDIRMIQRPIGPVAVFGASNFPLAFSVAGGDTASALAAGCPVVVKGHPAHPGTGEIVADAIKSAIESTGMSAGVFALVQGGDSSIGEALVRHPLIRAVGFTGGLAGGRALFDLCAARPDPIPFFGELGSINPMFLLPQALSARATELGAGWAGSLTMGAGQFCTNPGVAVVIDNADADQFVSATAAALDDVPQQTMLTGGIAHAYRMSSTHLANHNAVRTIVPGDSGGRTAKPALFETSAEAFLADPSLGEEVFGPAALAVCVKSEQEMIALSTQLDGQLTATIHMDGGDADLARQLCPILERKAGRVLFNGFPTGVEVVGSMVHGGPYPASTNFGATSVGTLSIRRWLRPVAYQNMPSHLHPEDLAEITPT